MKNEYIDSFTYGDFVFAGAHRFFNDKNSFLLSNIGTSIVLSNDLVEQLKNKQPTDKLVFKLFQRGFGSLFGNQRFQSKKEELPNLFMIDFTTKCNCNCIYCLRHFENVGDSISEDNLFKITSYIISYCHANNVREISFQAWGGEPLLEIDKIVKCKRMFDESGVIADFVIQTNGILLTEQNYKILRDNNIHIGISIDGIESVHDAHRVDLNGGKTHSLLVKRIATLKEKYPDFQLYSLSVNSMYSLKHIKENIRYLVETLECHNIKFNLVHPSGFDDFCFDMLIKDDDLDLYVDSLLDGVIEEINKGLQCNEYNISTKLFNIINRRINDVCISNGCHGGLSFVSFDQYGNAYPCEMIGRKEFCLGHVDKLDLVQAIKDAKNSNPYYSERHLEGCRNCPFLTFCGGGCKASCLAYGKTSQDIDEVECHINKHLYPRLIELILDNPRLAERITDNRLLINESK